MNRTRSWGWTAARRSAVLAAVALLGLAASASAVLAGAKTSEVVSINLSARSAEGSLGSTRATSNGTDYIGCWSRVDGAFDSGVVTGGCSARQRVSFFSTRSISCAFPEASIAGNFVAALNAMTPDAHVRFTWASVNGVNVCQTVKVSNYAHSRPTTP